MAWVQGRISNPPSKDKKMATKTKNRFWGVDVKQWLTDVGAGLAGGAVAGAIDETFEELVIEPLGLDGMLANAAKAGLAAGALLVAHKFQRKFKGVPIKAMAIGMAGSIGGNLTRELIDRDGAPVGPAAGWGDEYDEYIDGPETTHMLGTQTDAWDNSHMLGVSADSRPSYLQSEMAGAA